MSENTVAHEIVDPACVFGHCGNAPGWFWRLLVILKACDSFVLEPGELEEFVQLVIVLCDLGGEFFGDSEGVLDVVVGEFHALCEGFVPCGERFESFVDGHWTGFLRGTLPGPRLFSVYYGVAVGSKGAGQVFGNVALH
jgi:hypothetical protein